MEHWNLRRWPGPFDWIFSGPEMVTHCLAEGRRGAPGGSRSFATFLDASKYLAKPCNKAKGRFCFGMRLFVATLSLLLTTRCVKGVPKVGVLRPTAGAGWP